MRCQQDQGSYNEVEGSKEQLRMHDPNLRSCRDLQKRNLSVQLPSRNEVNFDCENTKMESGQNEQPTPHTLFHTLEWSQRHRANLTTSATVEKAKQPLSSAIQTGDIFNCSERVDFGEKDLEVSPNALEFVRNLLGKAVVFLFSCHYFTPVFTVLSVILAITSNCGRSGTPIVEVCRNFLISGFLAGFTAAVLFLIRRFQKWMNLIEIRVAALSEELTRLQKNPIVQAQNLFTEGSEQNVINILVNEGDARSVEQILKSSPFHETPAFKFPPIPSIAQNAYVRPIPINPEKEFGLDKETYEALHVLPMIPSQT